ELILFNCVSGVSSECTKLGKLISTFDHGLCDFGLPSQPSNFLKTCWVLSLLGYGSSGGGIKSLPSGLKGWGRHVMGLEALAGKRCSGATVGLKSGKEGKGFWTWQYKVPTTVNEMIERLDDFARSEEAYASTELPKGETEESHRKISLPFNRRDTRPVRDNRAPYPPPRGEYNCMVAPVLTLNCLTKHLKEILATEKQLRLTVPQPMLNPLKSGNADRYGDYHQEKGRYTNDCIQLRKQLEIALESGKLNHLVKDVHQRGRGSHGRNDPHQAKIINMINVSSVKDKKRKVRETTESWMNIPISFLAISSEDISEEPLIVEAEVEGYLVRRVYVDEGPSVEVMFEHYFENLNPKIKERLRETQTDLVGFAGEVSKPLGKIELEVCFANGGLCRRTSMKFIVEKGGVAATEEVLINPSFPDQLVTISGGLSEAGNDQLKCLLKDNVGVFAWEPSNMTGTNLEAYVDDMVIKSSDEKMLLADIAKTFDNLKKINMKLNPKKCSFRVEEGKFMGYTVTLEGIRPNPKKTKSLTDLQSPRTLKEMQSLNGKLASLSRFLAKSSERSLPFLNTLKNITKENKHEYRWMQEAEEEFQHMKRLITELPSLTPPREKETLYAYLAVSAEAVSAVLLTDRKGRQCLVQYVSRTLNEAERNYAPMEKLALSLIHMTRRLRRYFEAHLVKVTTDQPIKNILNNMKTSEKLAKYDVDLGAYNIMFIPRNTVKGQVLAYFLSDAPEGTKEDLYFRMPEAEYEALLSGLRIARRMNISNIEVKVDSKLVASQINRTYEASMIKYLAKAREYVSRFESFSIKNIPRNMNQKADVLSKLAYVAFNHLTKEANRLVERENRSLMEGIKTRLGKEKTKWVDELPNVLWAHRTSIKQSNRETPFSLTYGSEAVIPVEIGILTYRTLMIREGYNEEEMRFNLDLLQERKEAATIMKAKYKTKMDQYGRLQAGRIHVPKK
nr:reverse transcriptase domain-containing protein [Tanacetum cinerariifolium]